MTSYVFDDGMTSLNVHLKLQKWKVLLITDIPTTPFLKNVSSRGESFGFSTLRLSNTTIAFLSPNATTVIQPLD